MAAICAALYEAINETIPVVCPSCLADHRRFAHARSRTRSKMGARNRAALYQAISMICRKLVRWRARQLLPGRQPLAPPGQAADDAWPAIEEQAARQRASVDYSAGADGTVRS